LLVSPAMGGTVRIKYRGRELGDEEIDFIRELIANHPTLSRWALSRKLCEAWGWVQENGALRDMMCRSLMLELHRGGHITLPLPRLTPRNHLANRRKPKPVPIDRTALRTSLDRLRPLEFRLVRRTEQEPLFNSLIEEHHYLGYTQPVGAHLKYLVLSWEDRPVACLSFSSAPLHLGPRDRFIGWTAEGRRKNLHLIAYNPRYLILPWVEVPHLASHILGRIVRRLPRDWERVYGHRILFLETFVDPSRYRGTCYRAANWIDLGKTTGRGKDAPTKRPRVPIKDVLGYPLTRRFRELLGQG